MANRQNVSVFSGNDLLLKVRIIDGNTSTPMDLSGIQNLEWSLGKSVAGPALVSKTLGGGVEVTDAIAGLAEITVDATELEPLNGEYYHEARLTSVVGKKATIFYGRFTALENLINQ